MNSHCLKIQSYKKVYMKVIKRYNENSPFHLWSSIVVPKTHPPFFQVTIIIILHFNVYLYFPFVSEYLHIWTLSCNWTFSIISA